MKTMKLLDLETNNYLELGKHWLYGGDWIVLMSFMPLYNRVENAWFIEGNEGTNITNARYLISEPPEPLKPLCERIGVIMYGGRYVLLNTITIDVKMQFGIEKRSATTGDNFGCGLFCFSYYSYEKYVRYSIKEDDYGLENKTFTGFGVTLSTQEIDIDWVSYAKPLYNIFEEYSKQLRNEPNKFEELLELLK